MKPRILFLLRMLFSIGFLFFLSGCSGNTDIVERWKNYHYRLSNVFDFAQEEPQIYLPPKYPTRRQLRYEASSGSINLLDFLRLSSCELQRLLGERNSSLGRLQADSQRWIYDLRFITAARDCLAMLEDGDLKQAVQQAERQKRAFLPRARWNSSWASSEFQTLFSIAGKPVQNLVAARNQAQVLVQLDQLFDQQQAAIYAHKQAPDLMSLEPLLAQLVSHNGAGRVVADMALATTWLEGINSQMAAGMTRRPLCPQDRITERGRTMERVFQLFYIGEIQPWLSQLHQRRRLLYHALSLHLDTALPNTQRPAVFTAYWRKSWDSAASHSLARRFDAALQIHVQLWQRQLAQCGLQPGR